jgi:methanogenic corrinoid protein MtbC1
MPRKPSPAPPAAVSGHPIAVVAERTGLSRDVIRMWERRYSAVEPDRTSGGERFYSDEEVNRLRLLAAATRNGRGIRTVASLPTPELERLVADDEAHRVAGEPGGDAFSHQDVVDAALAHTRALDAASVDRELRRTLAMHGAPTLLQEVVPVLMHRIGEEWQAGRLTIAHEHLASAVVMGIVLETLRAVPERPDAPRLLVTTPSGELHAIGAALAATAAALDGWSILHLGVNVPAADIAAAASAGNVHAVALSVVNSGSTPAMMRELQTVRAVLPSRIPLIVGGAAAARMRDGLSQPGFIACESIPAMRRVLEATRAEMII